MPEPDHNSPAAPAATDGAQPFYVEFCTGDKSLPVQVHDCRIAWADGADDARRRASKIAPSEITGLLIRRATTRQVEVLAEVGQ